MHITKIKGIVPVYRLKDKERKVDQPIEDYYCEECMQTLKEETVYIPARKKYLCTKCRKAKTNDAV